MSRPLRIEYEDALHHVISRGDNRRRIVWAGAGRRKRLSWLERALVTYLGFKTYGYRGKELSDAMGYRDSSSVARSATRVEGSPALLRVWRKLAREVKAELAS